MNIQKIRADKLNPAKYNPRKDLQPTDTEYKKLKRSIEEFGYVEPVIWNERTGNIVGGHQRYKVLCDIGVSEIDCVVVDIDEQKEKALNVALNKIQGEWDDEKLAQLFAELDSSGFDSSLTGFDTGDIEAFLDGFYGKNCVEDDFDEEKAKEKVVENGGAVTQAGDIWHLVEHKLICADSTLSETFEKLMDGNKAQLCVTSPPYGVGKSYEEKGLEPWFDTMRPAIKNICKNADTVIINLGDLFSTGSQFIEPTFSYCVEMLAECGFRPLWIRIWDKFRKALSSSAPYHLATLKPVSDGEYIGAFSAESDESNEEIDGSEYSFISAFASHGYKFTKRLSKQERREWGYSMLWRFASVSGTSNPKDKLDERNHHARFPVELPWRSIKMHSDAGNIILEPFCGSGTTIIACEQLGRRCFAVERDETYCDISIARFRNYNQDAEIFLQRGEDIIPLAETGLLL